MAPAALLSGSPPLRVSLCTHRGAKQTLPRAADQMGPLPAYPAFRFRHRAERQGAPQTVTSHLAV